MRDDVVNVRWHQHGTDVVCVRAHADHVRVGLKSLRRAADKAKQVIGQLLPRRLRVVFDQRLLLRQQSAVLVLESSHHLLQHVVADGLRRLACHRDRVWTVVHQVLDKLLRFARRPHHNLSQLALGLEGALVQEDACTLRPAKATVAAGHSHCRFQRVLADADVTVVRLVACGIGDIAHLW